MLALPQQCVNNSTAHDVQERMTGSLRSVHTFRHASLAHDAILDSVRMRRKVWERMKRFPGVESAVLCACAEVGIQEGHVRRPIGPNIPDSNRKSNGEPVIFVICHRV